MDMATLKKIWLEIVRDDLRAYPLKWVELFGSRTKAERVYKSYDLTLPALPARAKAESESVD